jgi:hypothetical protein
MEMRMRNQALLQARTILIGSLCGAILLSACARQITAPRRDTPTPNPVAAVSVFVGPFNGEFARELRSAIDAELQKSPRYRVVVTEAVADYVVTGFVSINTRPTSDLVIARPAGFVQVLSRASGTHVWQYTYRDQRTGVEFVVLTPQQQVRAVARQFVIGLQDVRLARASGDTASF